MNPAVLGAIIHHNAPHTPDGLYLASVVSALAAVLAVYIRCRLTSSDKHLPHNWIVATASVAAPVPTWCLLLAMPLDTDLGQTIFHDPVVVALAGAYGLAAAFRDTRGMASQSRKRRERGDRPTDS